MNFVANMCPTTGAASGSAPGRHAGEAAGDQGAARRWAGPLSSRWLPI